MTLSYAPIVLFTYNRADHVRQVIDALLKNREAGETDIIIYSDAPKNESAEEGVKQTRDYLYTITGFNTVKIVERDKNYGLARNIIDGVTTVVNEYGWVIVLEDDHITSPFFLQYMNEALKKYEGNQKVASIHGYVYPSERQLPYLFFIKGADCWGWATWKRAWDKFNPDGNVLLSELERNDMIRDFDFDFSYPFTRMLEDQIKGRNQSWAIRWCASTYINDMYTLYPGTPMVSLIGNDGSGTHGSTDHRYDVSVSLHPVDMTLAPEKVELSKEGYDSFKAFFIRVSSIRYKVYRAISLLLGHRSTFFLRNDLI